MWETVFEVATGIPYVDVGGKKQSNITVWLSKSVPGVAFVFKVIKKVCFMLYPLSLFFLILLGLVNHPKKFERNITRERKVMLIIVENWNL